LAADAGWSAPCGTEQTSRRPQPRREEPAAEEDFQLRGRKKKYYN